MSVEKEAVRTAVSNPVFEAEVPGQHQSAVGADDRAEKKPQLRTAYRPSFAAPANLRLIGAMRRCGGAKAPDPTAQWWFWV